MARDLHCGEGMHTQSAVVPRERVLPTFMAALLLAAACGDAAAPPAEGDESSGATLSAALNGADVLLARRSSLCGESSSSPLIAQLGSGIEFPSDRTKSLSSPCDASRPPGVEVDVENGSILFDFSQVDQSGTYSNARFDGYVLRFERHCGDPIVTAAKIDSEQSNIDLGGAALNTHYDRVEINFARAAYDQRTFLKIDLDWAEVDCLGERGLLAQIF